MIAELVSFRFPPGTTRAQAQQSALSVVPAWQANPDLIRKHFLWGGDGSGAGLYFWPSREAAQVAHTPEWIARKEAETGSRVEIQYFDVMLTLDNRAGTVDAHDGSASVSGQSRPDPDIRLQSQSE